MAKITVIITSYNLETMIGKCFDELFSQTLQDFNILLIDDCSKDKTVEVVKSYVEKHPDRIRAIFLSENQGSPSYVRNIALESGMIDGEYVVFLDGDDSVEQDYLETLYNLTIESNADIAVCAYDRVEQNTNRVLCTEMQGFPKEINMQHEQAKIAFVNTSLWNKLIRTSIIGDLRFPNIKIVDDACFFYALMLKCEKIAFTNKVLLHYVVRENSIINNDTTRPELAVEFADELISIFKRCDNAAIKEVLALAIFIHIGIALPLRLNDNPNVDIRRHVKWTHSFFLKSFNLFRGYKIFSLLSLGRFGVRGTALWVCRLLYKLRCFMCFLGLYKFYKRLLRRDLKW